MRSKENLIVKLSLDQFKSSFIEKCEDRFDLNNGGVLIGLEIEFFLFCNKTPASLPQSQEFLNNFREVTKKRKLNETTKEIKVGDNQIIESIKIQVSESSWICLDYEFMPHLFEISFSYHKNLFELKNSVTIYLR